MNKKSSEDTHQECLHLTRYTKSNFMIVNFDRICFSSVNELKNTFIDLIFLIRLVAFVDKLQDQQTNFSSPNN